MPNAKSGAPGNIVAPADPDPTLDADKADPGAVEIEKAFQEETKTGKYGSVPVPPYQPPEQQEENTPPGQDPAVKTSWIEIVLVDANNVPVAGENYKVTLPDQSVKEGTLDNNGFARVDGIDPGNCDVTFPYLDGRSWSKVG